MEDRQPDWEYWLKLDGWSLREAVWLMLDREPGRIPPTRAEEQSQTFLDIEEIAINSNQAGRLPTIDGQKLTESKECYIIKRQTSENKVNPYTNRVINPHYNPNQARERKIKISRHAVAQRGGQTFFKMADSHRNLSPAEFINWAIEKGYDVPTPMEDMVCQDDAQINIGKFSPLDAAKYLTVWFLHEHNDMGPAEIRDAVPTYRNKLSDRTKEAVRGDVKRDIKRGQAIIDRLELANPE